MHAALVTSLILLAAQTVLWQRPTPFYADQAKMPVSPEVHPDRRVTFRLLAPKASEVLLVDGNLEEFLKGPQPMTKDEKGVWSITVGPLPPEVYDYGFAVDGGIRSVDPANRNAIERTWGPTNFVEVQGDRPAFYSLRPVPRGTVHMHTYDSRALGVSRKLYVYTPPGYEQSGNARYPILYLFHGSGGVESQWTEIGRANVILDNLIADGKAKPMVVVMPYGHVPRSAAFEKDLIGDIIPFAERSYRVFGDRDRRAIAGLSMGGGQSLSIGLAHLDLFSHLGVFSGAVGSLSDIEKMDPGAINKQLKVFWIGCGKTDFVWDANRKLTSLLNAKEVRHGFRVSEGGHTWPNWRLYLSEFAPLLFQ